MGRLKKRSREIAAIVGEQDSFTIEEAIDVLKKCPPVKFDQSVELSLKLGVDPRKADQQVRGTVSLPNGTGKTLAVLVLTKGDKVQEALDAGADFAGHDELIDRIKGGWTGFDAVVATPDMMREVGKLGKVLGPRGLMPTPKAGTVTNDVAKAVEEIKAGKVEYKVDRNATINNAVGKISFDKANLVENVSALLQAVVRAKPSGAKGTYIQNFVLSSTMGPGLKIDPREIPAT
jgi:large subunit ribosomal protein L1